VILEQEVVEFTAIGLRNHSREKSYQRWPVHDVLRPGERAERGDRWSPDSKPVHAPQAETGR
jgi:hypothetical protein